MSCLLFNKHKVVKPKIFVFHVQGVPGEPGGQGTTGQPGLPGIAGSPGLRGSPGSSGMDVSISEKTMLSLTWHETFWIEQLAYILNSVAKKQLLFISFAASYNIIAT